MLSALAASLSGFVPRRYSQATPAAEPPVVGSGDEPGRCSVTGNALTSKLVGWGEWEASVRRERGTSPLGEHVAVPRLRATSPPRAGSVYVGLAELSGSEAPGAEPSVTIADDATGDVVTVRWPDGACVVLPLPRPPTAPA